MPFAHNIFMNMAAEGGILGFATFVGVVIAGIYGGWRWYRAAAAGLERMMAAVFLAAFVGSIVHQLFDGTLLSVHLGLGLWILLAILSVGWTRATGASSGPWTSA
jgi:O-antigen ligase